MGNCCKTKSQTVVAPQILSSPKAETTTLPGVPTEQAEEERSLWSLANLSDPRRPRGKDPIETKGLDEPAGNYFEDSIAPEGHESVDDLSLIAMWEVDSEHPRHPLIPPLRLDKLKSTAQLTTEQAEVIKQRWSKTKQPGKGKLNIDLKFVVKTEEPQLMSEPVIRKFQSVRNSVPPRPPNLLEIARNRSLTNAKSEEMLQNPSRSLEPIPFNSRFLSSASSFSSSDLPKSKVVDSTPIPMSQIATLSTFQAAAQHASTSLQVEPKEARHSSLTHFANETTLQRQDLPFLHVERSTPVRMSTVVNKEKLNGSVKINGYAVARELGSGAFGKVFEVEKNGQKFAMKEYNKKRLKHKLLGKKRTAFDSVLDEVALLSRVEHPNIIYLHEVIDTPESRKTYLVMELASKGSLQRLLPLPETQAKLYFAQIVLGVEYLHEVVQVVHRDLKPDNILIDSHDTVKISDFGSAQALQKPDDTFSNTPGTPVFQSPEQWGGSSEFPGKPLDIWALGVTLYYMLFNRPPFAARRLSDLQESIKSEK